MKKLDILIIKSFLGPLLLTFSIAEFVLLLQFLWKQLEKMIGKGLETTVILQLIWYISATLVPMALPLAILLASIMTLGNFGERYELVAMKSSGISLWRILRPLMIVSFLLSGFAFFFSNNYMPIANMKMRTLLYEINTKKPTVNIRPNAFYSDIDNYVIKIGAKDEEGKNLTDVMIFDHSRDVGNSSITIAKTGQMYSEDNGNTLVFNLKDGYTYDETTDAENFYRSPLIRLYFKEQYIRFDISNFAFSKTDKDRYAGHYKMMNITELNANIDTLTKENILFNTSIRNNIYNKLYSSIVKTKISTKDTTISSSFYSSYAKLPLETKKEIKNSAKEKINSIKTDIEIIKSKDENDKGLITRHDIEWHRKFTLSAACIILFFIGAPLGAIIRKGGLGMPVVISVFSFILYYVVGMIGERAAVGGSISCMLGMWSSTLVFLPLGLFLTMKATSDSALMNPEGWVRLFNRFLNYFVKK